ncbi:MAG: DEAD/DEAH box helicase, partial [Candidatus Nanoarchaeia archaeon]
MTNTVELGLPKQFADILWRDITLLNPVQLAAIKAGLLELKDSFVISSPTASGKTLIAELFMIKAILEKRCKAIYVVPLRALANEKYLQFKEKYSGLGIKVAISTGDFDSVDMWLADYNLIILTSEKVDSLLRHKAPFLQQVGVAVIDECHLITDVSRGPTLEIAITRLRKLNPKMLFLLLSATIANANELAGWLNAKVIKSDFRPVKLHEGVYYENKVWFEEKPHLEIV